jgi:3-oxoacyl-[acyl-carrier-protein] synthase-1
MTLRVTHPGWGTSAGPCVVATSTVNGLASSAYETWAYRRAEQTAFVGSPFRLPSGNVLTFARVRELDPKLLGGERLEAIAILALERLQRSIAIPIPRDMRIGISLCLPERMDGVRSSDRDRRSRRALESRIAGAFIEAGYDVRLDVHARGHASLAFALMDLSEAMRKREIDLALMVGIDGYYDPFVLEELFAEQRVLDTEWRDAFVPGEAASALLIARPDLARQLGFEVLAEIESIAVNKEVATLENDVGNLGLGLSRACVAICKKMKEEHQRLPWWICDVTGETFRVQELQLAWPRAAHLAMGPDDTIDALPTHLGDIGSATMPTAIAVAIEGLRRGDPAGDHALVTASSPLGDRGAVLIKKRAPRA